jgi:redox-sensitive bicupin YhaK (pirin superfamily)
LVASPDGRDGSLVINQDAFFTVANIDAGKESDYQIKLLGNGLYLFVLEGEIEINGAKLKTRDGLGISALDHVIIKATVKTEILLMEVPMKGFE